MSRLLKQWLAVTALFAVAIFLLSPAPQFTVRAGSSADEGWLVPRVGEGLASPERSTVIANGLSRAPLWSGQTDAVAVDSRANQWRIAGITGRAGSREVLVQFGDERMLSLKAGDKFPDDTPIAEVRDNGVCVTLSGKRRFLPLSGQTIPIVW